METDQSLQYSSAPPANPFKQGSLVTLISKIDIRYEGILFRIDTNDSILCLINVICYGTEGRNGSHIPKIDYVFSHIIFRGHQIKEMIVRPSTECGYYYRFGLAKGVTTSSNHYAKKPPLPRILSLPSSTNCEKIQHKVPLVSGDDRLRQTLAQPQYSGLSYNDHWSYHGNNQNQAQDYKSMPHYGVPNQPHTSYQDYKYMPHYGVPNQASELNTTVPAARNQLQSFFVTFPPPLITLPQNFGAMNQTYEKYELWNPPKKDTKPTYTIDGSYYMMSRLPFDPIGEPYNPLGPIDRRPYVKEPSIDWSYDLKPPPFNSGWIY